VSTPTDPDAIREAVRERYAAAAAQSLPAGATSACCGGEAATTSCCGSPEIITDEQRELFGAGLYAPEDRDELPDAALLASLGCGNPTAVAELNDGETVLDLGSGGGIDVLIAARRVGSTGLAYGLDMTDEMLDLARRNQAEAGVENVRWLKGQIENIPLPDNSVDVIISNCVINLSADKSRVLRETARVLKPGGRLAVSDVIADPEMDDATRADMTAYTGCIAGALTRAEYADALAAAGLTDLTITESHRVHASAAAAVIRAIKPQASAG
jgi:SAM-dependent methyltransferase